MTRQELIQLRDAIDMALALPDSLRELLAQWLTPEAAKPNGHDRKRPCAYVDAANGQGPSQTNSEADASASCRAEASRRDA